MYIYTLKNSIGYDISRNRNNKIVRQIISRNIKPLNKKIKSQIISRNTKGII